MSSIDKQVVKELSVWGVIQTISKYTLVLVNPDSDEREAMCHRLVVGGNDSLEDLGDITQVESVMRFAWDWLEWTVENLIVYLELCLNHCVDSFLDV